MGDCLLHNQGVVLKHLKFNIETMKIRLFYLLLSLLVLVACEEEDNNYKKRDFNSAEEILANPDIQKVIEESGINIYEGTNPPNIEGEYSTDECEVVDASYNLSHMIGLPTESIFEFSGQTSSTIRVKERTSYGSYSVGSGAFIIGRSSCYTILIEANNSDGSTVIALQSGRMLSNGDIQIDNVTVITDNPPSYSEIGDWWESAGPMRNLENELLEAPVDVTAHYNNYVEWVDIEWSAVEEASKYMVYRSTSSNGSYDYIGYTDDSPYLDLDNLEAGNTYYYKVTAVDVDYNESEMSDYAYITIPDNGSGSIEAPTGLYVTYSSSSGCINLSWNTAQNANSYKIYKSMSSTGAYSYLKEIYSTSTTDCYNLTEGNTYYYKVSAVSSDGTESYKSNYDYATVSGGSSTETDIIFNNPLFTDIYVTLEGITKTISPGSSVTFYGIPGSSVSYSAYTSGQTTSGTQVGLKITWNNTLSLYGGSITRNLITSSSYFFLYMQNTSSHDLNPLYVNYGLSSQTQDNIVIYNTGTKYRIGYYKAWSNSNVRAYWKDQPDYYSYWDQGTNFTLPFTDNQSVTLYCNSSKSNNSASEESFTPEYTSFLSISVKSQKGKAFVESELNPYVDIPNLLLDPSENEYCSE